MRKLTIILLLVTVLIGALIGAGSYWGSKRDRFSHIHQEVLVTEPGRFDDARAKAVNQPEGNRQATAAITEIRKRLKDYREELPSLKTWVPGEYYDNVMNRLEKLDQRCRDWLSAEAQNPE